MSAPRKQASWQDTAGLHRFPVESLNRAAWEILSMLDRVLCRGEGWGSRSRDKRAKTRRWIEIKPEGLSKHGCRFSSRTYWRAIRDLERLGLIRAIRSPGKRTKVTPSWWRHPADGGADLALEARIWGAAAAVLVSLPCPTHVPPMSHPPVRREPDLSAWDTDTLQRDGVGQIARQSTEYRELESIGESAPPRDRRLGSRSREGGTGKRHRDTPPEGVQETLREIGTDPAWKGIGNLIPWALREAGPDREPAVVSAFQEVYGAWCTREIKKPCAYLRRLLSARLGLPTRPADFADRTPESASAASNGPSNESSPKPVTDSRQQSRGIEPVSTTDSSGESREREPLPKWILDLQERHDKRPPAPAQSDHQEQSEALCAAIC